MSRLSDLLNPTPSSRVSPNLQPVKSSSPATLPPSLASPLSGLALDGVMDGVAVKREPSDTASPAPNGYAGIAQTIESAVKTEAFVDSRRESTEREEDKPLADSQAGKKAPANGIKKSAKKGRAIVKPKNAGAKNNKKGTGRTDKTTTVNGAKQPAATTAPGSVQEEDEYGAEEDGDEDDDGVFCVCRGPDDHTWMIGCDGECEDWFHGRCVKLDPKDADLIEKYICPNCYVKGTRQTTWKPMCRLEECRKPARVNNPSPSKYCSDAHGEEYFRRRVMQKTRKSDGPPPSKRRQVEKAEDSTNQTHLYGGLLSRSEVKTLADSVAQSLEFNGLGNSAVPPSGGLNGNDTEDKGPTVTDVAEETCTREERDHLIQVLDAAAKARHSLDVLSDKEKLLKIARSQAAQKNAEAGGGSGDLKKKETFREVCGYDSRLSWNEDEFDIWRKSEEGRQALEAEILPPPTSTISTTDADGDSAMADDPVEEADERREAICGRKRCERHKTWWKIHFQNITHERKECHQKLERLGAEARAIQERAVLKEREESAKCVA